MAHRAKKKKLFARKDVKKSHRVGKQNPNNKNSHRKTKQNRHNFKQITKENPPIYIILWTLLSPKQKSIRERSLDVLSTARKSNQPLSKISKNHGISVRTVIRNTNAFKKVNGKWIPKKYDKIPRMMIINENGKKVSVEINDSRIASTIGRYHNAVKEFLNTGNKKKLLEFSKKKIRDSSRNFHSFETSPNKIIQIEKRVEEPEFVDVYDLE